MCIRDRLCVQASAFLSFDIVILCLACDCIILVQFVAYIHELCMTLTFDLYIKIIFSPWIWVLQNVIALWQRHTKFWHMGVSLWDNMLFTFLTLAFDLYAGGILSEFYSQFLSCLGLIFYKNNLLSKRGREKIKTPQFKPILRTPEAFRWTIAIRFRPLSG